MSIESILLRLRESRINEEGGSYEYKFDIPWREQVASTQGDEFYRYGNNMDYAENIMQLAEDDFNYIDWRSYMSQDVRTSDFAVQSMAMSFDEDNRCVITVVTKKFLNDEELEDLSDYIEGQMSDGWGEGFEQRLVADFRETDEEWVADDEYEDGGYYEEVDIEYDVYGQFWWQDSAAHPYGISLIYTSNSEGIPTNESLLKTSQLAPGYKIKDEEGTPVEIVDIKKLSNHEYDIVVKLPDGSTDKWYDYEDEPCWERVKESVEKTTEWEYWDMPKDHKGPFEYPHYFKSYTEDVRGYIYPPYKSPYKSIEDIKGYHAELYDVWRDIIAPVKEFSNIESAKEYLDSEASKYLSKDSTNESNGENYISVEYTYNGDDVSNYLGHVKVSTDFKVTALQAAFKYAMNKHPEDEPRHFVISDTNYTNVDIIDKNGNIIGGLKEMKESDSEEDYRELDKERERRRENQCEYCGSQLTDSGECPKCDLGEED